MKRTTWLSVLVLALAGFAFSLATPLANAARSETAEPTVVFLVRHAEKEEGLDPALTEAGRARAEELARTLRDAGIERVHSTDYARTRATAAPLAERLGLEVELYDPRALPSFLEGVRDSGGRHLVVGHSNTTPQAVGLLGGEPGEPIVEATEYDRLYAVTLGADGSVSTVLWRLADGG